MNIIMSQCVKLFRINNLQNTTVIVFAGFINFNNFTNILFYVFLLYIYALVRMTGIYAL